MKVKLQQLSGTGLRININKPSQDRRGIYAEITDALKQYKYHAIRGSYYYFSQHTKGGK